MMQNPKVIKYLYNKYIQGPANPKYKTILCKHFDTPQGCSYGEKCQFAHGNKELRAYNAQIMPQMPLGNLTKSQNSILNYKIVKCKNFEKDGTCKYGQHCTFAHGDKDLRNKTENMFQINNPMMIMPFPYPMEGAFPVMMSPQGVDMNQMQLSPMMGQNPQFVMMNMMPQPGNDQTRNNDNNGEQKADNNQQ